MFEQLKNPLVQLMLELSRENIREHEQLRYRLQAVDWAAFFALCREHELDGVVASHILSEQLAVLPDDWQEAHSKRDACHELQQQQLSSIIPAFTR